MVKLWELNIWCTKYLCKPNVVECRGCFTQKSTQKIAALYLKALITWNLEFSWSFF